MKKKKKKQDQLGSLEVVYEMCLSIPQFLFIIDEQRKRVAILILNISYPSMLTISLHCTAPIQSCTLETFEKERVFFFFFFKIFWVMQNVLCNVHMIFRLLHISYFYKPLQLSCTLMYGFPLGFWLQRLYIFHCWFKAVANIILSYALQ